MCHCEVYPGTLIDLPPLVADVWRAAVWLGILWLIAQMGWDAAKGPSESREYLLGRVALAVLLLSELILDIERWGQPITWEGLPVTTVAVILAFCALHVRRRPPP